MRECPGEQILQSYLDGELSNGSMEGVRSHLASCVACSVAAREFERENNVVAAALAPEFEASVPTERLRSRIDAAIAAGAVSPAAVQMPAFAKVSGWFQSLSDVFAFNPQRAFGYAGLAIVLIFAIVFAVIQRQNSQPTNGNQQTLAIDNGSGDSKEVVTSRQTQKFEAAAPETGVSTPRTPGPSRKKSVARGSSRGNSTFANHVKLLPGERSYLQTIAELDSTINKGEGQMRPAIQAEYERNLAFVDRALAAARTAAKSKPNDPDAAEFMFSAYQSKLDLMNAVADARVYNRQQ